MSEIAIDDRKCQATTKLGQPCRAKPLQGHVVCSLHSDPERARELAKRPRKNGANAPRETQPPEILQLQTASQIRDFLAQLIADVRQRVVDAKTASTLGTLATSQLKAISAAELEERVSNLEKKVGDSVESEVVSGLPSVEEWEHLFAPDENVSAFPAWADGRLRRPQRGCPEERETR